MPYDAIRSDVQDFLKKLYKPEAYGELDLAYLAIINLEDELVNLIQTTLGHLECPECGEELFL